MESPQGQGGTSRRLAPRAAIAAGRAHAAAAVRRSVPRLVTRLIVNVALPSIQRNLHFSQQNLQWVASSYILTYGGFLLLGGRLGDLGLGRLPAHALSPGLPCSPGGVADRRTGQDRGPAGRRPGSFRESVPRSWHPAALSQLTTTFREGKDRNTALGAWGAISGVAAAARVFLGGLLAQGPGWRWVFFINPPTCALVGCSRPRGRRAR